MIATLGLEQISCSLAPNKGWNFVHMHANVNFSYWISMHLVNPIINGIWMSFICWLARNLDVNSTCNTEFDLTWPVKYIIPSMEMKIGRLSDFCMVKMLDLWSFIYTRMNKGLPVTLANLFVYLIPRSFILTRFLFLRD